jgi:hypothetical protein
MLQRTRSQWTLLTRVLYDFLIWYFLIWHNFGYSVFDAKRLIGRKFEDAEVQADIKHFPFKVINKSGKPYIRISYRGKDKEFVRRARFTDAH